MSALFSGPLAQAIGWALLHLLWQGVVVAAILAAVLALLHRQSANARYLASCGALIVIVGLSVATAYRAYDPIRTSKTAIFVPVDSAPPLSVVMEQPGAAVLHWTDVVNSHLSQIVLVWLLGVIILSSRLILGWVTANRLASRYAHIAEAEWQQSMERIAAALHVRRTIQLLESAAVDVPTVIGWLRPAILLPVATLSGLSPDQIEMILAHELAHIRRHDFIVNLMQSSVETLFFYQPAVWWISRRIRIEREHCCDDIAVAATGDALRYARALTRFEELRIDHAQTVLAASGGSLLLRIRRLVGVDSAESASWSSRWTAGAALLVIAIALLVSPALPAFAKHDEQKVTPAPAVAPTPHVTATCPTKASSEIDVEDTAVGPDHSDPSDVADLNPAPDPPTPAPPPVPMVDVDAIVAPILANVPMAAARFGAAFAQAPMAPPAHRHFRKINEQHLSVDDLVTLRSVGVTSKYIDEMRNAGLGEVSLDDIASMRAVGITPEYINAMRDAGIDVPCAETAIELRGTGVTPAYLRAMANLGYAKLTARQISQLRALNVTPDLVKALADAGYANLPIRDLMRLAGSGVTADFIRDLAKYRTKK